nr:hypothetical protein [uncultured Flavobacterium sp.]
MTRIVQNIRHQQITEFHQAMATAHKGINGFYRFDVSELDGNFRNGVEMPVMMLESYSGTMVPNANATTHFYYRDISFLLLDFAGKTDDYDKQEEVLTRLEGVGLDICTYLNQCRHDPNHFLYMLFDAASFRMEKYGPVFENMYGWIVMYTLKAQTSMIFDPDKWNF